LGLQKIPEQLTVSEGFFRLSNFKRSLTFGQFDLGQQLTFMAVLLIADFSTKILFLQLPVSFLYIFYLTAD
jgi:hypothetical protein